MSDNISSSLINDLTRQVGKFSNSMNQEIKTNGLVGDAYQAETVQTREMSKAQKQLSDAIQQTAKSAVGFAKQLQSGNGSFQPLTTVVTLATKAMGGLLGMIPLVGSALKGLAEGAGEVGNMMIETYDKVYGSFEKLSDSGVVASFDDLQRNAADMKMTMSLSATAFEKRSKELALFGGSALKGTKFITQLNAESQQLRDKFQKLGISGTDFLDYQISYMSQQNLLNSGRKKSNDELIAESEKYVKELDATAKLTGISRKEAQSNREARLNDVQLLAGMKQYGKTAQGEFNTLLDTLTGTLGKEVTNAIGAITVSGGKINNDVQRRVARQMPEIIGIAKSLNEDLKSGKIDQAEYVRKMTVIAKKSNQRYSTFAQNLGDTIDETKDYVAIQKLANSQTADALESGESLDKLQTDTMTNTKGQNAELAGTKRSLENVQSNIEQLATSSELVTGLMQKMAEGIEGITEKFYEMTKEEMPAHLKAASEARKAIQEEAETRLKLAKAKEILADKDAGYFKRTSAESDRQYLTNKLLEDTKKKEAAIKKREAAYLRAGIVVGSATTTSTDTAATAAPTSSAPTAPTTVDPQAVVNATGAVYQAPSATPGAAPGAAGASDGTIPKNITFENSRTGNESAFNALRPDVKKAFDQMAEAYGKPIRVNSAKRTQDDQARLYNGWIAAGGNYQTRPTVNVPGIGNVTIPVKPGTKDSHIEGRALDLDQNSYNGLVGSGLAKKYGFQQVAKDPGHLQLSARTGGIFSGPDTGYLTELHGDEIVAPVGKQALNTSMLTGLGGSSNEADFDNVYNQLEDKLDRLISVMNDTMKANKKQSMAKFM